MNAPAPRGASPEIEALHLCDQLVGEHLRALEQLLGAPALGLLDLPPLTGDSIEADQLRAVAPLYWAMHAEDAGLLAVVEALAMEFVQGALVQPIGRAGHLLFRYWQARGERFRAEERRALYSRLFGREGGDDPNHEFPELFGQLVGELVALGRSPASEDDGHGRARITALAADVAQNLSPRSAGVAAFAARDILDNCRQAIAILRDPEMQSILGGGGVWAAVARLGPRLVGRQFDPTPELAQGNAGLRILAWIADSAGDLQGGLVQLRRSDPVVLAAEDYQLHRRGGLAA